MCEIENDKKSAAESSPLFNLGASSMMMLKKLIKIQTAVKESERHESSVEVDTVVYFNLML